MDKKIKPELIYSEKHKETQRTNKHKDARLYYSTKKQEEWYKLLKTHGIVPLEGGWLNIRRWGQSKDGIAKIEWQKIVDIEHAIRMQGHILNKYESKNEKRESELGKINTIEEIITYANSLLSAWNTLGKKHQKNVEFSLLEVVSRLSKCRNEFLKKTIGQAAAASSIIDSKGRVNPGAMAARTIAALNFLSQRMKQLQIIIPLIAMRREILILEKNRMIGELKKIKISMEVAIKHIVFNGQKVSKPQLAALGNKIGQFINQLDQIHISPYFEQAKLAEEHVRKAKLSFNKYFFMQTKEYLLIATKILEVEFTE